MIPWEDRDKQRDRNDVERNDAPCHITHSSRNTACGIGGLPCCQSDDLRSLKVDENNDHRKRDAPIAVRRKASAAEQDARSNIALVADQAETDEERHRAERHKRNNLDKREPEFALAKFIDTKQIEKCHNQSEENRPPNRPDIRKEAVHNNAGSNHLRGHIGDPRHRIRPADPARPCGRNILPRIDDKRARERLLHGELR